MNKRGFLLGEETVKIIIAVICLVVLVYFLVSLYISNQNKELKLAKASLEHLITDINAGRVETEIYNPKGWGIASFSTKDEKKPKICLNKDWNNCLCICQPPATQPNSIKLGCLLSGNNAVTITCLESEFSINDKIIGIQTNEIVIIPPLFLSINQKDKIITEKP
ncbi:MAG: hypothetical protein Q7S06_03205 [Nanoarchaeota archaeon]|nr:hypothetical protein [Nanoarchaeota archaeon]